MKDILATPLGDLIASIGNGVADAQTALDEASLSKTLEMYTNLDDKGVELMRQIGYQPAFYVIPETEVEASVSIALSSPSSPTNNGTPGLNKMANRTKVYTTPTNAGNANKYNMQANASTKLKFKIVPVPPSNAASDLRVSPDLMGKTEDEAALILSKFDLLYEIGKDNGSEKVVKQVPPAGSIMNKGEIITIDM